MCSFFPKEDDKDINILKKKKNMKTKFHPFTAVGM